METPADASFQQLRVAAFESRRCEEMKRLIERSDGIPFVSPSMQEVPIEENQHTADFANSLITGRVDVMIFLTGVGFRYLLRAVEVRVDRQRFLDTLSDIVTIARGPKPAAAMKEVGVTANYVVPSPNTWRELLTVIDAHLPIANQTVAIQEYGEPNTSLIAGLEARGASVRSVPVYRWTLPDDDSALRANIEGIVAGKRDVCLFTSAQQVVNLMRLADEMGVATELASSLRQVIVCSIGPTTSEAIQGAGLHVDLEPTHPKMGHLVRESAMVANELKRRKTKGQAAFWNHDRDDNRKSGGAQDLRSGSVLDQKALWYDSPFMRACRREPVDVTPVWLMQQAASYLPEYRALRKEIGLAELIRRPDLCAEIMVSTVRQLGVDAAIIVSDCLPMFESMGLELEYDPSDRPTIHNPVRSAADIDRVTELQDTESLNGVMETVRRTRIDLPADCPLIGFAGAPFTMASYVIEGRASRVCLNTKTLMFRDEGAWRELMSRLARSITAYLNGQIAAGAQCVQMFDSRVGCLSPGVYRRFVLPYVRDIILGLPSDVPVISFASGNPALLTCLADAGPHVIGIDWRVPLDVAWKTVGPKCAVQGNLDPTVLFAQREDVVSAAHQVLESVSGRDGHIFNLGHGILPRTPVDNVLALVDAVHEFSAS